MSTPPKIIDVRTAAAILNLSPRQVREICKRNRIGVKVNERQRVLTTADIPKIREIREANPPGNPNLRTGRRKKTAKK